MDVMSTSTDEEGAIQRQKALDTLMTKVMEEVNEKHSKGTLTLQTLAQSFLDLNIPSWLDDDNLLLESSYDFSPAIICPIVHYCWDKLLIRPCDPERVMDVVYNKLKYAVDTWDPSQGTISFEDRALGTNVPPRKTTFNGSTLCHHSFNSREL